MPQKKYTKLALMGGAYGNLSALEACVQDACLQGCDGLFFLGDAIGFAGHSDETLNYIFDNFDIFIAGNLETQAANGADSCACGYSSKEDEATGCRSFQWSLLSLTEPNMTRIGKLPEQAIINTAVGPLLLCHGSPDVQNEFLYASEITDEQILFWLDKYSVNGFVCTHTGLPWINLLDDGRFAVNCGVTGKPDHDGDVSVHYAIIDCSKGVKIDVKSVSYAHESLARQLRQEGVEEIFITPLLTGLWTCGVKSLPIAEQSAAVKLF